MPQLLRKPFRGSFFGATIILIISGLLAAATAWLHPRAPSYSEGRLDAGEITLTMVEAHPGAVLWVDARAAKEYAEEHIPDAIHLNEDNWEEGLMVFFEAYAEKADALIVVYCGQEACQSSKAVATRLQRDLGMDSIYHLRGGWATWKETQQ